MHRPVFAAAFVLVSLSAALPAARAADAERKPHAGMLRFPDISQKHVVFVYAGQLWLAPRDGGMAQPVARPPGDPRFPRFSADGETIAFMANYDGNSDLYTIDVDGGVPQRVTHHPWTELLNDWTPDGRLLFFASGWAGNEQQQQLLTIAPSGGFVEKLPVPYGAVAAISPDGAWLAYTLYFWDHRTWKRYMGGTATDIWLFNLKDKSARRITDWGGADSQPMWHGGKLYYISDAGDEHRLNIWVFDPASNAREQITRYGDFDVKWPAVGPGPSGGGEIVFQHGVDLVRLDLATKQAKVLEIRVPGDQPQVRPLRVEARAAINTFEISATGKRAVFEARGDVWSVPARHGATVNLTRTAGVAERDPYWSPDGRWISYFSDATGEYELYVMRGDGKGEPRKLTGDAGKDESAKTPGFRYRPQWSPDSKKILFIDKAGRLFVTDVEAATTKLVDTEPWQAQPSTSWSHDSSRLAYTKRGDNQQSAIWLYSLADGGKTQLTSGAFHDASPAFDREGKFLYYTRGQHFDDPIYEDVGNSFIYANTEVIIAVPLNAKILSPLAPRSDEETAKHDKKDGDEKDGGKKGGGDDTKDDEADDESADEDQKPDDDKKSDAEAPKPIEIDVAGFEARGVQLPVDPGRFGGLTVSDEGRLIYIRADNPSLAAEPALKILDVSKLNEANREPGDDKGAEQTIAEKVSHYAISPDGKKLLVESGGTYAIIDAKPEQKLDAALDLSGMVATIDPRVEWRQLFHEAWRLERDFFYDANMHGVDWPKMREHYAGMLSDCATRADVGYVISELISELNVGHAYYGGNDDPETPRVDVGMLGVDFELANNAYRLKTIYAGAAWDGDGRGPLSEPGMNIKEGDYLLAVNGAPLDPKKDPWASFQGLAGKVVSLTISDSPTLTATVDDDDDGAAASKPAADKSDESGDADEPKPYPASGQRDVVVKLITTDQEDVLRYRAWVEGRRQYVAKRTQDRVAYIHVPDTGTNGQNELFRQFYGQRHKPAMIIDERWNGGGQLPHRFIELLNRPATNYWDIRDGRDWPAPDDAHFGPKCMLINQLAGSGGDMLPWLFRFNRMGTLIGTRTWGGLVGISGNPNLIDGASVTAPTFAFFELDGTWGVEGWGVDPDIEVIDDPSKMQNGEDPQLDAAIALMLDEVQKRPFVAPKTPAGPNRRGMGVRPEDK